MPILRFEWYVPLSSVFDVELNFVSDVSVVSVAFLDVKVDEKSIVIIE